ncbi:MAG: acylphosphatase [Chloroflexota bacterium]
MNERLEARVRGYVQGVGFRWFVVRNAARLGLSGWTANEPDGSVRVVAEGPVPALDEMLVRLKRGPAGASVETVDAQRSPARGDLGAFTIRAGAHPGD